MSTVLTPDFLFRHHMAEARITRQAIRGTYAEIDHCEARGLTQHAARTRVRLLHERARLFDHLAAARAAVHH